MPKTLKRGRTKLRDEDIFDPKSQVQTLEPDRDFGREPERDVYIYTIYGQHDYLDHDDNPTLFTEREGITDEDRPTAFAKKVVSEDRERFFIKSNGVQLYNPIGVADENRHNKFLQHAGKKEWKFVEVSPKSFRFYLAFLRTKNVAHHLNAQRETA